MQEATEKVLAALDESHWWKEEATNAQHYTTRDEIHTGVQTVCIRCQDKYDEENNIKKNRKTARVTKIKMSKTYKSERCLMK